MVSAGPEIPQVVTFSSFTQLWWSVPSKAEIIFASRKQRFKIGSEQELTEACLRLYLSK